MDRNLIAPCPDSFRRFTPAKPVAATGGEATPDHHWHVSKILDLTPRQRLKLAEVLLVSADGASKYDCQSEWDVEIEARIQAINQGRETGISFEEVMATADKLSAVHHPG